MLHRMFILTRSLQNLPRVPIQCCCYSTARQPHSEADENAPKTQVTEPVEHAIKRIEVDGGSKLPIEPQKKYDSKDVTKADMKWRTPWHQKEAQQYSALRSMYSEDNQTNLLKLLQTEIDLSPSAIKKWWIEKEQYKEMMMQSYIPERNQTLGNELAAAHFIVFRGGAVKFYHEDKWVKADKYKEYKLPKHYQEDKILQAIDCTDMNLYYEGLANLKDLKRVEWLSFNGVENFDDWFLDKISSMFSHSLVYLDIRNCPKYTERGLGALCKMDNLKILYIDDMLMTTAFEMTCLLLQEVNPNLDIKIGDADYLE